jgi:hypothetical protein
MANTLKFGTDGNWATKKGSTLSYNDEGGNYKPLPFTTTRNSIATRVNKEGLIEVVGNDVPRIDYTDSADGVLLLENSSTNLVTYSEDLNNFSTSNQNITINPNQTTSPSGNLADKIEENNVDGSHAMRRLTGISTISSQNYTFSFFAKKDERSIVGISNTIGGADKNAFIDIENGIILSSAFNDSSIDNYGNGWYKISLTHTATNTSDYDVRIYTSIEDANFSHQGVVGYGFYIWGISVEQSSFSTSYIPTNGSAVTRVADTASGAGNSQVFNDSEGVLFAEISALANDGNFRRVGVSDNSISDRVIVGFTNVSNQIQGFVSSNGSVVSNMNYTVSDAKNNNKVCLRYKQDYHSLWINGFEVLTTLNANTPIGLSDLSFDSGANAEQFYGKTKELGYYDEILTDLELETLTSYRSLNELVTELNLNEL